MNPFTVARSGAWIRYQGCSSDLNLWQGKCNKKCYSFLVIRTLFMIDPPIMSSDWDFQTYPMHVALDSYFLNLASRIKQPQLIINISVLTSCDEILLNTESRYGAVCIYIPTKQNPPHHLNSTRFMQQRSKRSVYTFCGSAEPSLGHRCFLCGSSYKTLTPHLSSILKGASMAV